MKTKSKYKVIGLMSGTSLDGLDIVCSVLTKKKKGWNFQIEKAKTEKYSALWKEKLATAHRLSGPDLLSLHVTYGRFLGDIVLRFIRKNNLARVDFIASHGHTVFHQPHRGFTFQLGDGHALHAVLKLPVVYDFRSLDVSQGGQGAPLVPVGDRYLFDSYDCCLNLGGIANVSMEEKGIRKAFDICFVNMGLNYLALKTGKEFDKNGMLASQGKINERLLGRLEKVYSPWRKKRPSLSREMFERVIQPLLDDDAVSVSDRMATFCRSVADEVQHALPESKKKITMLVTGGGALNVFLMDCIKSLTSGKAEIKIPSREVIEFKEGLIFGLLGVLRVRNEVNCLKSVTGARRDVSGGTMIGF